MVNVLGSAVRNRYSGQVMTLDMSKSWRRRVQYQFRLGLLSSLTPAKLAVCAGLITSFIPDTRSKTPTKFCHAGNVAIRLNHQISAKQHLVPVRRFIVSSFHFELIVVLSVSLSHCSYTATSAHSHPPVLSDFTAQPSSDDTPRPTLSLGCAWFFSPT